MLKSRIGAIAVTFVCAGLFLGCSCVAADTASEGSTNIAAKNAELIATSNPPIGWQKHTVVRTNGKSRALRLPAQFQLVSARWKELCGTLPGIVYMPEKKRLLIAMTSGQAVVITSDDFGATWSEKRFLSTDAKGNPDYPIPIGVTYLGNGNLTVSAEGTLVPRKVSHDYGLTWAESAPIPSRANGEELYHWDPMLVDTDKSGSVTRLAETRYTCETLPAGSASRYLSQAYIWFSADSGKTWSKEKKVPQWSGVNEVALARAKNGDIIAACRMDISPRLKDEWLDHYCGLGVSISKDNGLTWSTPDKTYDYGRHHASFAVMPNGSIVMAYVVRLGYTRSADGFPRFGVEAVVSRDNGKTWDMDNKYILAWWTGKVTGNNSWWGMSQMTSTALLPDGSLLTVFATGFRNEPSKPLVMDAGMVKWKLDERRLSRDRTIRDAPIESDARNLFDVASVK